MIITSFFNLKSMKHETKLNLGLLIIRLNLALVFIIHGWLKLQNLESTGMFFESLAIPYPHIMAYVAGVVEFGGGILLALGIFSCLTYSLLAITMLVAVITTLSRGFVDGYEFAFVCLCFLIALLFTGPGEWTFKKLFHKRAI